MDLVILAGGKSRRMGSTKALLDFDQTSLIETVIARIRHLFDKVIIASAEGNSFPHIDATEVKDSYPGCGSLGGLHAGLTAAGSDRAFALACDMPFVNPELVRMLMDRSGSFDVVVPATAPDAHKLNDPTKMFLEPLHAIYAKTCLPHMERLLRKSHLRIFDFFPRVKTDYVELEQIRDIDPQMLSFFNINTPDDFKKAQELRRQEQD